MRHLIADTHFHHPSLIKLGRRPANCEELMWAGLQAIPAGDTLIHLGDICISNHEDVHERVRSLPCKNRILIRGNHDTQTDAWYLGHGWIEVLRDLKISHANYRLHVTHKPARRRRIFSHNIHGHTHGTQRPDGYHIDLAPELVGYAPLAIPQILQIAYSNSAAL